MAEQPPYSYEWDSKLNLSNPKFEEELTKIHYDERGAKRIPFPSDYILAIFSNLAYKYKEKTLALPQGWKLLTIATNTAKKNGYVGAAFWHPKLCQIVVAHKGTDVSIKDPGALYSDLKLAINSEKTPQSESAATFVHKISEAIKKQNEKDGPHFLLSTTGHSLGAWLAQMTTFTVKYFKIQENFFVEDEDYTRNIHAHTVVFESPGCQQSLKNLVKVFKPHPYEYRNYGDYDVLDMTVYLSKLNPINSINKHVGRIYRVDSKTHSMAEIVNLFDVITQKIPRKLVLAFSSGFRSSFVRLVKNVLPFDTKENIVIVEAIDNQYSFNIFNESELDFVLSWHSLNGMEHNPESVRNFKKTHDLIDFTINYDYKTIEGDKLSSVIASIKRLRPTKATILNLLKDDVMTYFELFKLEALHFNGSLREFDFYLKDKYDLKGFLLSGYRILNVHVRSTTSSDYEFEICIIKSLVAFYNKYWNDDAIKEYFTLGQYYFIKFDQIRELLNFLPRIIANNENCMKLLIVQCFDGTEGDILKFLSVPNVKVILLTVEALSPIDEKMEVREGYGNNIRYEDLMEISQQKLLAVKSFVLHGEQKSLSDIIESDLSSLNHEMSQHMNEVIPARDLLQLNLTSSTQNIILDCPYNSLYKKVVVFDLYRKVDYTTIMEKKLRNSLFLICDKDKYYSDGEIILNDDQEVFIKIVDQIDFDMECTNNIDKVIYFFVVEHGKLYLNKIFNTNLYVPRKIKRTNIVKLQIFDSSNDDLDHYFFYGNETRFKKLCSYLNDNQQHRFKFEKSERAAKSRVKNADVTGSHLLHIDDEHITWIYSRGNINSLRKYMEMGHPINENNLIESDITILCGEPGIGKSSTVGNLFAQYHKSYWIFVMALKFTTFDDLTENIDYNSVAKFIVENCDISNRNAIQVQHLLMYSFKNETNLPIYLMFDGFDEMDNKDNQEMFIKAISFMNSSCRVKILITTRKYKNRQLENGISVFASQYELLNQETDVNTFFMYMYKCQMQLFQENYDNMRVKRAVTQILDYGENIFGTTFSNFIGVPLHMRMLAELLPPDELPDASAQGAIPNVFQLYEKYIKARYSNQFKRSGHTNEVYNAWVSENLSTLHYKLAVRELFNLDSEAVNEDLMEELNRIGLVQKDLSYMNHNECVFLHDSVRDYFVAYFLTVWLKEPSEGVFPDWSIETFVCLDLLLKEEYREIRLFLNCYFKNVVAYNAGITKCAEKFQMLWQVNEKKFYNKQGECCYHICARENLFHLLQNFVLQFVRPASKIKMLSSRNSDLQTPIFLAIESQNADLLKVLFQDINDWEYKNLKKTFLSTLFTYYLFAKPKIIETLVGKAEEFQPIKKVISEVHEESEQIEVFLNACKLNKITEIDVIFKTFKKGSLTLEYLITTTNELKETCLHLATNRNLVQSLIKVGANIDSQDHHGMTPLTRAIKRGFTDIAVTLIKNGASVRISDYVGNSPLIHSAKYDNLEVIKLILSKSQAEINIDHTNVFRGTALMVAAKNGNKSIVSYLLLKGADCSATDWNGMTPVYHAVKGNHTKLIKMFRDKNADLNVRDEHHYTPLLYSIKNNKWDMVNALIDNGADINLRSGNHLPLRLLIEKNRRDIIKKVLKVDDHQKAAANSKVIYANTEILT